MNETLAFLGGVLASAVRVATPLSLAASGETLAERSGVINVGVEGIMIAGALASFLAAHATGSALAGLAAGVAVGLLLSAIFALLVLGLRADQVVCGLGLNLLAFGAAGTAYQAAFGTTGTQDQVLGLAKWDVPILSRIPLLGPAFFQHEPLAYFMLALALGCGWIVFRSTWGLALRAAGDEPLAADAAGVPVVRVRALAVLAGGALAALAGADLALAHARAFAEGLTNGRGFMALAIVLFGRWSPARVFLAALFFGLAEAFETALQARQGLVFLGFPISRGQELILALPYLLTLATLALPRRKGRGPAGAPAALGVPYRGRS
ncbi:ABC transporter permease [bacterium]|nr:ABC transporter permease [bacterium]